MRTVSRIALDHFAVIAFACTAGLISITACASPDTRFTTSAAEGVAPLEVTFSPATASDTATFTWDFGDGSGSDEASPTHVYETAGQFSARLTVTEAGHSGHSSSTINVEPGEAGWVVISSEEDSVVAGESVQLVAEAFDSLGNPVHDAQVEWRATEKAGTISADGVFTAAAVMGSFNDAVTASFERFGTVGNGAFTPVIEPGPIARVEIDPVDLDLIVGQRIAITATVFDSIGTVITDSDVTFNAVRDGDKVTAGGELTIGAEATKGREELLEITAKRNATPLTQTFMGSVKPSVLDLVAIDPRLVQLAAGETVQLSATGQDRFGNPVPLDRVEYSILDEGVGEITSGGKFTAAGHATNLRDSAIVIKGWSAGVWRKTQVPLRVTPGAAASIEIAPADDSVPMGAGSPMTAVVRDKYGNQIPNARVQWDAGAGGTITAAGTFIAGFEAGVFMHSVIATVPPGAAGNADAVGTTANVTVRPRSADMIAVDLSGGGDSDIALIDLRTAAIDVLVDELPGDGAANESGATWYPDGSRLAFSSDASGTPQIYDYDPETGEVRQLTEDPNGATMPAISPDGTRLAWVSRQSNRLWQIFVADIPAQADGEDLVPIVLDDAVKISRDDAVQSLLPFWSPDGQRLAYTTSRSVTDSDIRIVAADGSADSEIVSDSGYAAMGWNADGTQIRAVTTSGTYTGLLVDIDGESGDILGTVPIPVSGFSAAWSPDQSELAVMDRFTGDLWLSDADGTGLRVTLSGSAAPTHAAWRPIPITGPLEDSAP